MSSYLPPNGLQQGSRGRWLFGGRRQGRRAWMRIHDGMLAIACPTRPAARGVAVASVRACAHSAVDAKRGGARAAGEEKRREEKRREYVCGSW